MSRKKFLHYILVTSVFVSSLGGCQSSTPNVSIFRKSAEICTVKVEIARNPAQRSVGLMFRKTLPEGHGMLFVFEVDKNHKFTMKNTFIPLDMLFLDRAKKVAGWVENAQPLSQGPYHIGKPSRYVLEVNAFFREKYDIKVGDEVRFVNIAH
jgi:uncharacterized membrane protein (UPF0127 family)